MKKFLRSLPVVVSLSLFASLVLADGLQPIESEMAHRFGKLLSEQAAKIDKLQIKVEADPDKANGVHKPDHVGMLVVPQKDLKENDELDVKLKSEKGAPLAYLFLYHLVPVIDGKTVDASRLRTVTLTDDQGQTHSVYVLPLAGKGFGENDYRLHAYGYEDKPLLESKFAEGSSTGSDPVTVDVKELNEQTQQGKLVLTVFGKYQTSFTVGYKAD